MRHVLNKYISKGGTKGFHLAPALFSVALVVQTSQGNDAVLSFLFSQTHSTEYCMWCQFHATAVKCHHGLFVLSWGPLDAEMTAATFYLYQTQICLETNSVCDIISQG